METSARQNVRIDELFQTIAFQVLDLSDEEVRRAKEKDQEEKKHKLRDERGAEEEEQEAPRSRCCK